MINRILDFLTGPPAPRALPQADAAHLLGALLVRLAQADDQLRLAELQVMDRVLSQRFGLNAVDAARMRADCERLAQALPPTERLGPLLITTIPPEQRFALREALMEVARADGALDAREVAMLDQIGNMLEQNSVSLKH